MRSKKKPVKGAGKGKGKAGKNNSKNGNKGSLADMASPNPDENVDTNLEVADSNTPNETNRTRRTGLRPMLSSAAAEVETEQPSRYSGKRQLVRWTDDMDQYLLLAVQSVCNHSGQKLAWDQIARWMGPPFTVGAIIQHVAKLRQRRAAEGLPNPPALTRGGPTLPKSQAARKMMGVATDPEPLTVFVMAGPPQASSSQASNPNADGDKEEYSDSERGDPGKSSKKGKERTAAKAKRVEQNIAKKHARDSDSDYNENENASARTRRAKRAKKTANGNGIVQAGVQTRGRHRRVVYAESEGASDDHNTDANNVSEYAINGNEQQAGDIADQEYNPTHVNEDDSGNDPDSMSEQDEEDEIVHHHRPSRIVKLKIRFVPRDEEDTLPVAKVKHSVHGRRNNSGSGLTGNVKQNCQDADKERNSFMAPYANPPSSIGVFGGAAPALTAYAPIDPFNVNASFATQDHFNPLASGYLSTFQYTPYGQSHSNQMRINPLSVPQDNTSATIRSRAIAPRAPGNSARIGRSSEHGSDTFNTPEHEPDITGPIALVGEVYSPRPHRPNQNLVAHLTEAASTGTSHSGPFVFGIDKNVEASRPMANNQTVQDLASTSETSFNFEESLMRDAFDLASSYANVASASDHTDEVDFNEWINSDVWGDEDKYTNPQPENSEY